MSHVHLYVSQVRDCAKQMKAAIGQRCEEVLDRSTVQVADHQHLKVISFLLLCGDLRDFYLISAE